jgi:hypothetical protein
LNACAETIRLIVVGVIITAKVIFLVGAHYSTVLADGKLAVGAASKRERRCGVVEAHPELAGKGRNLAFTIRIVVNASRSGVS